MAGARHKRCVLFEHLMTGSSGDAMQRHTRILYVSSCPTVCYPLLACMHQHFVLLLCLTFAPAFILVVLNVMLLTRNSSLTVTS